MGAKLNIKPGDKFSRLTIVREVEKRKKARFFLCKCDCGTEKVIRMVQLTSGQTKSCGCFKREHLISMIYKNGLSRTKLYKVWTSMKQRCMNPKCDVYMYYGERGVLIYKDWLEFENFYNWAVGNGYEEGLTIERIDVNSNYEPNNCTWIPQSEQSSNTRRNRLISYNGKKQNIAQWVKETGLSYNCIRSRLKRGWDIKKTLTEPIHTECQRFKYETKSN